MSVRRVAIVGAGVAGLSLARRLGSHRREAVVFDKARRPGGRVATRRAAGLAFDHGAQYFTCRDASFEPLVAAWCERGLAAPWKACMARLKAGSCSEAPGDSVRYVGVPGMSALASDLAADVHVECGRRIRHLERSQGRWTLVGEDGTRLEGFDAVVVAAPAPQAARLLAVAPELQRRASAVVMQPCHAAMLAFAKPAGVHWGGAFVEASPLSWVARNASKPGRDDEECWVLHATPAWSSAHLEESSDRVGALLLEALALALDAELPPISLLATHRWRFASTSHSLGEPFLWDPEARLGACGDWTFGGRIESAFLSGDLLAHAVLDQAPPERFAPRDSTRS